MAKKSRDPRDLSHDDLVTWSKDEVDWLGDHAADPDLTPRSADFIALATAYEDAYNAEITPEQLAPLLHDELEVLDDVLIDVLRLLRIRIPLLPGVAEPKLAPFGLGADVPTDWDELVAVATVCMNHWLDISGGGVPPEFAPVEVNMGSMVSAAEEFISKHSAYRASIGDKQDAVAYKNQCRDTLLECEREIFHWYRAAHPDADDPWWSATPWGTASGEPEEPPAPVWPDWPGPVEGSIAQMTEGLVRITYSGLNGGKTLLLERLKHGEMEYVIVTDGLPIDDPEEVMPFDDNHLEKGTYTYKLTPFDEAGNPGVPLEIDITVI